MSYYEAIPHPRIKTTNTGMQDPSLVIGPEHPYWKPLLRGRVDLILPQPDEVLEAIEVRDNRLAVNGVAGTFQLSQAESVV